MQLCCSFSSGETSRFVNAPFRSKRRKTSRRLREGETARRRGSGMGKGGELWDDSALVDAFDRAMFSMKVCLLVYGFYDFPDHCASLAAAAARVLGFWGGAFTGDCRSH